MANSAAEIDVIPQGTCSTRIRVSIDKNGIITACHFEDGCEGNAQGLSRLVVGRKASEVACLLEGIQCQNGTSCPDQLARAIRRQIEA